MAKKIQAWAAFGLRILLGNSVTKHEIIGESFDLSQSGLF
jgi:hypothetical protein